MSSTPYLLKVRIFSPGRGTHYLGHRVSSFLSGHPNWVPPPHHPQKTVAPPPPLGTRGEAHSLEGEGVGAPNSDDGTGTLVLCRYTTIICVSGA
jgi:hypothetical protein